MPMKNRNPVRLTNKERKSYLSYQQFKHQWRKVNKGLGFQRTNNPEVQTPATEKSEERKG